MKAHDHRIYWGIGQHTGDPWSTHKSLGIQKEHPLKMKKIDRECRFFLLGWQSIKKKHKILVAKIGASQDPLKFYEGNLRRTWQITEFTRLHQNRGPRYHPISQLRGHPMMSNPPETKKKRQPQVYATCKFLVGGWATPLKNISQLGWLFPIYGKIKNVPNHQPEIPMIVPP